MHFVISSLSFLYNSMRARRSLMKQQQYLVRTCLLQADHPNSDENHEVTKRFLKTSQDSPGCRHFSRKSSWSSQQYKSKTISVILLFLFRNSDSSQSSQQQQIRLYKFKEIKMMAFEKKKNYEEGLWRNHGSMAYGTSILTSSPGSILTMHKLVS